MAHSRPLLSVAVAATLAVGAGGAAWAQSAAERAVEAAKQFSGTTLNITWEAALQAQDPLLFSGPKWEELTGIKINVVEIAIDQLFTKTLAEHRANTGAFDLLNVVPAWLPDLAEAGVLEPLDPFIDKYGYREELEDIAPVYRDNQMTYQGTVYGLPDDGDVLIMYYRKDLFGDPARQTAFKERFGYELAPPETWEQFLEISQYFTENPPHEGFYGSAMIRAPGHIHYYFEERFRVEGGEFFDPDTMEAKINSDAGVKTLAGMVAEHEFMPPGVEAWGPIETLSAWLAGDLAMMGWWPPPGRWSDGFLDPDILSFVPVSEVEGKVGYALPPGGAPQLAAGFSLSVASTSRNKEAAYLFAQWLNSKEISLQRVQLPYALRDPFRTSHFENEEYQSRWGTAKEYLETLQAAADSGLLDLSIRSTFLYEESLTRAITAAFGGADPKEMLDQAAEEWNDITKRIGVDTQKEAYLDWAGKPAAYPQR
ncbi:MAG: ABC transporter substrate-binding protein [Alphaproteobacteria bacterium]